jgi:hypothetical protein
MEATYKTTRDNKSFVFQPCVPIISHRRPAESVADIGENLLAQWRPDSSMICVVVSTDESSSMAGHV